VAVAEHHDRIRELPRRRIQHAEHQWRRERESIAGAEAVRERREGDEGEGRDDPAQQQRERALGNAGGEQRREQLVPTGPQSRLVERERVAFG